MNTLLIADAYDYFNLHKPAISYRFINDENPNGDISPNWSNLNWDEAFSYYYQPNLEYIVEVPFNKNNYNIKSIGNEFDVFDSTQLSRIKPTAALIISKNENNEIRMSIIEVLGCRDYYEMYGYDNINSYGSIDDNFKGIVSFYNAEGKPLSNYYIIDEKVHVIDSIWRTSPSSTAATARWGYFCFQEWENYWDASCPCFIAELVRVTCIDIGPTRIIGGPPGLVGGKRVITAPWNTGGSGGGSNDGGSDGSTYLSDLIVNCLSEGGTDIESIRDKLKNIFAKCPQVNSNMIESLASRMNRLGSQNWSSLLAGFIKSYLICPECLENVYSENCLGSKNTRSSKLEEINIKYNSFGKDEDEFISFVNSSPCKNICSEELEKCLVKHFYDLTDEEWEGIEDSEFTELDEQNLPPGPYFDGNREMCNEFLTLQKSPLGGGKSRYGISLFGFKMTLTNAQGGQSKSFSIPFIRIVGDYFDNEDCIQKFRSAFALAINEAFSAVLTQYRNGRTDVNIINISFQKQFRTSINSILNTNNCSTKPFTLDKQFNGSYASFYIDYPNGTPDIFDNTFENKCP